MNAKTFSVLSLICLMAIGVAPVSAKSETFKVDPVHSMIFFKIMHAEVNYTYGLFFNPEGQFAVDLEAPEKSSVTVQVQADAINTGNINRDNHLRGPDFLNAKQFRTISFQSTSVKKTAEKTFEAKGKLTLHGVTKEITVVLEQTGRADVRGKTAMGFEGKFGIKRSDYGVAGMVGPVGDDMVFMVTLAGELQ